MKKFLYLSLAALMVLAASCKKETPGGGDEPEVPVDPEIPACQLPTTVWSGSWDFSMAGIPVPLKASLAFEDELVSLIFTSLEMRANEMPLVLNGHNAYRFEGTPDGSGQVSFTLSFQSSSQYFHLSETTFTGTFHPDSEVLDLHGTTENGDNPFGMKTLHFLKETNVTTQTNPFPATKWTASWNNDKTALGIIPFSAILAFEGTTVNLVIASEMTFNNVPVVMYGNGPYQFQGLSETDRSGNLSFMVPTRASTVFNIPETTFSGVYNPNSKVMTLKVSSENSNALGTDAIKFVRN